MSAFGFRKAADLPPTLPLFPLTGALLFPRAALSLNVFEPRYLNMVDDALASDRLIAMIQPAAGAENESNPALASVGTAGRITSFTETEDGRYLVTLTGICRFTVQRELEENPYRRALVSYTAFAKDFALPTGRGINREELMASLRAYATLQGFDVDWSAVDQAPIETVVNIAAQLCPFDPASKQALLEAVTLEQRSRALIALLQWDCASNDQDRPLQ